MAFHSLLNPFRWSLGTQLSNPRIQVMGHKVWMKILVKRHLPVSDTNAMMVEEVFKPLLLNREIQVVGRRVWPKILFSDTYLITDILSVWCDTSFQIPAPATIMPFHVLHHPLHPTVHPFQMSVYGSKAGVRGSFSGGKKTMIRLGVKSHKPC